MSQTLRAESHHELNEMWDSEANLEEISNKYGVLSLQTMEQFIDECEGKINNYEQDPLCYLNA